MTENGLGELGISPEAYQGIFAKLRAYSAEAIVAIMDRVEARSSLVMGKADKSVSPKKPVVETAGKALRSVADFFNPAGAPVETRESRPGLTDEQKERLQIVTGQVIVTYCEEHGIDLVQDLDLTDEEVRFLEFCRAYVFESLAEHDQTMEREM